VLVLFPILIRLHGTSSILGHIVFPHGLVLASWNVRRLRGDHRPMRNARFTIADPTDWQDDLTGVNTIPRCPAWTPPRRMATQLRAGSATRRVSRRLADDNHILRPLSLRRRSTRQE
jgi:hypothetical protein